MDESKVKARRLASDAILQLGTTNTNVLAHLNQLLKEFDDCDNEEVGVMVLMKIMATVAQETQQKNQQQPHSPTTSTSDSTYASNNLNTPPLLEDDDATKRVRETRRMLQDDDEVFQFVKGLVADLLRKNYVVIPRVLGLEAARELAQEVKNAHAAGKLKSGELAGGRTGKNTKYVLTAVRGDKIGWFDDDPCHDTSQRDEVEINEPDSDDESDFEEEQEEDENNEKVQNCWNGNGLQKFSKKMGTIVQLMASLIPELKHITTRSKAMVTCYPGQGTRYVRHVDNPHKNGRKLTVLYYLNEWKPGDGGEIRMFLKKSGQEKEVIVDIPPLIDTMVVFFSDERVPHEVLPTNVPRFTVTHWFYDEEEKKLAIETLKITDQDDIAIEEERIKQEIEKFEKEHGGTAQIMATNE
eukprot:m.85288 g.85288  ORF g.85288 m.85288 type:complete len:411 (-) comp8737_c0_seq2:185-1417(-)